MTAARAPAHCANCDAEIPPQARACPECGADERTGWREPDIYDGLDLPEDSDDAEELGKEGPGRRAARPGVTVLWRIVGIILLAIVVGLIFFTRFESAH